MKYFGTVSAFDTGRGYGEIKPETGGDVLRFQRSAFTGEHTTEPAVGQRLSYDVGMNQERERCALNVQTI